METDSDQVSGKPDAQNAGGVARTFMVLRALANAPSRGVRVTQLAQDVGLTTTSVHRLLQSLMQEGVVEQDASSKHYRLGLGMFVLAANAQHSSGIRDLCRPAMLRLCSRLSETVFLLVRSGFDAVCADRVDGPFSIRAFTGDIGGRVALGVGQGALAILAHLPQEERDEVIRYNLPRVRELGPYDEVYLRTEIDRVRKLGYAARTQGLLDGMAGLGVPIIDRRGVAVAALSIGTLTARLSDERLPVVAQMLQQEAHEIGLAVDPFDTTLRRPMQRPGSLFPAITPSFGSDTHSS